MFLLYFLYTLTNSYIEIPSAYCKYSRSSLGKVHNAQSCAALINLETAEDFGFYLECPKDGAIEHDCRPCESTEILESSCGSVVYFLEAEAGNNCHDVICVHGVCEDGTCLCENNWSGVNCDVYDATEKTAEEQQEIDVECSPISQQTYCRVICGEEACEEGFCSDAGTCICKKCPEEETKVCDIAFCNHHGLPKELNGECLCECTNNWEGLRCDSELKNNQKENFEEKLEEEFAAVTDSLSNFPEFEGMKYHSNSYCIDYEPISHTEVTSIEECQYLYQTSSHKFQHGYFVDCFESNTVESETMKCQGCKSTETDDSLCGSVLYIPYEECTGGCIHGECISGACLCIYGYFGSNCEYEVEETDLCADVHCKNGGTCTEGVCLHCNNGWTGKYCQMADACYDIFCNSPLGECVDGTCQCLQYYTGIDCTVVKSSEQSKSETSKMTEELIIPNTSSTSTHRSSGWIIFLLLLITLAFITMWVYLYYKWRSNGYKSFGGDTELISYQGIGGNTTSHLPLASE